MQLSFDGGAGVDTVRIWGDLDEYVVVRAPEGYSVRKDHDNNGYSLMSFANVERFEFDDLTLNLSVRDVVAAASLTDVQRIEELYVAFFNRIPDADGLAYWVGQLGSGRSIGQIADAFYDAGSKYASLTGFSATMSNADFVKVIYKNVLGRSGDTAPPAADVDYWATQIATGKESRGTLINSILSVAHSFKHDAKWGWVADLLDNKLTVANKFAVELGLNYSTADESIRSGMEMAAAVTPNGTDAAIKLIGVTADNVQLV